jgi:hypothetical protein
VADMLGTSLCCSREQERAAWHLALAMASTRNPPPQEFVNDICFRRSTEGVVTVVDSDIRTSASGGSWEDVQTLYIVMPAIGVSA